MRTKIEMLVFKGIQFQKIYEMSNADHVQVIKSNGTEENKRKIIEMFIPKGNRWSQGFFRQLAGGAKQLGRAHSQRYLSFVKLVEELAEISSLLSKRVLFVVGLEYIQKCWAFGHCMR